MLEVTSSSKRSFVFVDLDQSAGELPKRAKRAKPGEGTPAAVIARIAITAENAMCKLNAVWMNAEDIAQLYPPGPLAHAQAVRLVNLAGNIFKLLELASLPQGTILVNVLQNEQIQRGKFQAQGWDHIVATSVEKSPAQYETLKKLEVQLVPIASMPWPFAFSLDALRRKVQEVLMGQVLNNRQNLFAEFNGCGFRLTVGFAGITVFSPQVITAATSIDFLKNSQTIIYNRKCAIGSGNPQQLKLKLTSYNTGRKDSAPADIFVDAEQLKSKISTYLSQGMHTEGRTEVIEDEGGASFSILLKSPKDDEQSALEKYAYESVYTFEGNFRDFKLNVAAGLKKEICIYSGTDKADCVKFNVSRVQSFHAFPPILRFNRDAEDSSDDGMEDGFLRKGEDHAHLTYCISSEKLAKFVRSFPGFVSNTEFSSGYNNKKLAFKVENIIPSRPHEDKPFPTLWTINQLTILKFVSKDKRLAIVDHDKAFNVSKVVIKVKRKPLSSLFGPRKPSDVTLIKEKLEAVCRIALKSKVYSKQLMSLECEDAKDKKMDLDIKIKKMEFVGTLPKPEYGYMGNITPETKFEFKIPSESNVSLIAKRDKESPGSIMDISKLEDVVGGVSEQLKTILRKVLLSRGPLKEQFKKRGLKPIKGMLLYGPPGTGKTTLARNIGKIFGCSKGERFQLLNASELTDKYVGETEKKIRELFKPAEDAKKNDGKKSDLYVIVIDECEAMLGNRQANSDHPWYNSWVNQFLGKIDGLEELDNLFIILMTNRKEIIDPAILRPGRIELHLELGLADKAGRKQIFMIHAKPLREAGLLLDVDFDKLAEAAEGFTGAEIEGLVKDASSYSLERLALLEQTQENIDGHKDGMVTMEDFQKAVDAYRLSRSSTYEMEELEQVSNASNS